MLVRWLVALGGLLVVPVASAVGCGGGSSAGATEGDAAPSDASAQENLVGQDAGVDADATGLTFCQTLSPQPTICSDFDEPLAPLLPWTVVTANGYSGNPNVGMLAVDTTVSFSPPASATATTNAAADGGDAPQAYLRDILGITGNDVKVAFELLIPTGSVAVQVLGVIFENGDTLNLDVGPGGARVQECVPISGTSGYNCQYDYGSDAGAPTGVWSNVSLEVVVGPPATVTLTVAGQVALDHTALAPNFMNGPLIVTIGLFSHGPAPAQEVHLDNVVVNVTQ